MSNLYDENLKKVVSDIIAKPEDTLKIVEDALSVEYSWGEDDGTFNMNTSDIFNELIYQQSDAIYAFVGLHKTKYGEYRFHFNHKEFCKKCTDFKSGLKYLKTLVNTSILTPNGLTSVIVGGFNDIIKQLTVNEFASYSEFYIRCLDAIKGFNLYNTYGAKIFTLIVTAEHTLSGILTRICISNKATDLLDAGVFTTDDFKNIVSAWPGALVWLKNNPLPGGDLFLCNFINNVQDFELIDFKVKSLDVFTALINRDIKNYKNETNKVKIDFDLTEETIDYLILDCSRQFNNLIHQYKLYGIKVKETTLYKYVRQNPSFYMNVKNDIILEDEDLVFILKSRPRDYKILAEEYTISGDVWDEVIESEGDGWELLLELPPHLIPDEFKVKYFNKLVELYNNKVK